MVMENACKTLGMVAWNLPVRRQKKSKDEKFLRDVCLKKKKRAKISFGANVHLKNLAIQRKQMLKNRN